MKFFFDESGDFGFPEQTFDCYTQASLICPDQSEFKIGESVANLLREWKVAELHASELEPDQIITVAKLIGESDCQLLVNVTDTELISKAEIADFRLAQASKFKDGLDRYRRESTKAIGAPVKEIEVWMDRQIKRAGLPTQISHSEYLQAHLLMTLIPAALQKSIYVYMDEEWRESFESFEFVLDAKLPRKMAAGEKFLNEMIVPLVGSSGQTLGLPETWKESPRHPFVENFEQSSGRIRGVEVEGVISLDGIFKGNIHFRDSSESPGLQLADAVAHITRRAVLEPDSAWLQEAFDYFRSKLRTEHGGTLTIRRLRLGNDPSQPELSRYGHLYDAEEVRDD